MTKPRRGEIWLVNFDPSVGDEIQKVRPALVVQDDSIGRLALRIIVPVTEWQDHYQRFPWHTRLGASKANGLGKASSADALQVKSVSEDRFLKLLGSVTQGEVDNVSAAIALCVGYVQ
jgi:mRNA interferase MazF